MNEDRVLIEKVVRDYLITKMAPVQVYTEDPDTNGSYVVIEKTGASLDNLGSAKIAIQSYADSLYESAKLSQDVIAAMLDCISLNVITNCSLDSDYNFTDTTKKKYRYQAVFDLVFYFD